MSLVNLPDIIRLNRLMAASAAMAAVANASLLFEPGQGGLLLARAATGIALAGVYPPALKLVSTWFANERGLALGVVIGALTLGSASPHLVRALSGSLDWRVVVVTATVSTLAGAVTFLLYAREGPIPFGKAIFDPRQIGAVFCNKPLMYATAGYLGHMWELYAMWTWLLTFNRAALKAQGGVVRKHSLLDNFHCDLNGYDWLCRWRTTIRPLRSHIHDRRHDDRFWHMRGVYRVYLRRTVLVVRSSEPVLGNFNRRRLGAIFCGCHRTCRPTLRWHGAFGTTWARFCAHNWSNLADAPGRRRAGKLAVGLPRFGDRSFFGGGSDAGFETFTRQSENGRREAVTQKYSLLGTDAQMLELICRPGITSMPTCGRKGFAEFLALNWFCGSGPIAWRSEKISLRRSAMTRYIRR